MKALYFAFYILCSLILFSLHSEEPKKESKIIYFVQGYNGDFFNSDPEVQKALAARGIDPIPYAQLRKAAEAEGYDLRVCELHAPCLKDITGRPIEDFKYLIVFEVIKKQMSYLWKYPKEKMVLVLWEPPSVIEHNYEPVYHTFYSKVYTWRDDLVDNKKYFKIYYPSLKPMIEDVLDFDRKKLCTMICGNKTSDHPNELYSERKNVIDYYQNHHPNEFDLWGIWWSFDIPFYKGYFEVPKKDILKYYKFSYVYENIHGISGYITEKMFDCFWAGCVPICWGAPNLSDHVPKNCYIARSDFASNEELYNFLNTMKEEEYNKYLENIRKYLASSQAYGFTSDNFVKTFMEIIRAPVPEKNKVQLKNL